MTKRCVRCDVDRPDFLFSLTRSVCDSCVRQRQRLMNRRSRLRRGDKLRAINRQRYHDTPVPLRRCRNSYYQIRIRSPQNIPFWSTIGSVLPVYEYAHTLSLENPGFRYKVCHIVPMRGKEVCGLHTLENLRIVRSKIRRSPSARETSA